MAYCLVISELAPARREIISVFHKRNPHWTFLESAELTLKHDAFLEHDLNYILIVEQVFSADLLDQIAKLKTTSPEAMLILFLHDMPDFTILQVLHEHHIRVQSYQRLNEALSMVAAV